MAKSLITSLLLSTLVMGKMHILERQECGEICMPEGATSQSLPEVGAPLAGLYDDLIATVNGGNVGDTSSTGPAKRQALSSVFCCALKNDCYLLQDFNIPFCYDNYTTGFDFPDGSYGLLVTGSFTSASGTLVNLIYGDYNSSDGSTGNIYSAEPSSQPHTSTMPSPTPWTSSGVGTAVPASQLGDMTSIATGESSITAITLPSLTISAGPVACTLCLGNHSIIPGLTGLPPVTTAFNASTTPAATGNSTSGASFIIPPITQSWAQSFMVSSHLYVFFLIAVTTVAITV